MQNGHKLLKLNKELIRPKKVAANKIKLLQIKLSCSKFKIVAANFRNESLQIKTSKVCARTEGRKEEWVLGFLYF